MWGKRAKQALLRQPNRDAGRIGRSGFHNNILNREGRRPPDMPEGIDQFPVALRLHCGFGNGADNEPGKNHLLDAIEKEDLAEPVFKEGFAVGALGLHAFPHAARLNRGGIHQKRREA